MLLRGENNLPARVNFAHCPLSSVLQSFPWCQNTWKHNFRGELQTTFLMDVVFIFPLKIDIVKKYLPMVQRTMFVCVYWFAYNVSTTCVLLYLGTRVQHLSCKDPVTSTEIEYSPITHVCCDGHVHDASDGIGQNCCKFYF